MVQPGDKIKIEKLEEKEGATISFKDVLLVEKDPTSPKASEGQGKKVEIGKPFVEGAVVTAKVLNHGKADKVVIFKYKPKKRESRKIGHRQPYTEIEITEIK